jgi:hypothetical protein
MLAGTGNSATMRGAPPESSMMATLSGTGCLRIFATPSYSTNLAVIGRNREFGLSGGAG